MSVPRRRKMLSNQCLCLRTCILKVLLELNGQLDPDINALGRIKPTKALTKREIKDRELLSLARKVKPLMAEAIGVSAKVMRDEKASHASQLKASALLLTIYQQLVRDIYEGKEEDEEGQSHQEIQEQKPLFSLTVVDKIED